MSTPPKIKTPGMIYINKFIGGYDTVSPSTINVTPESEAK